MTLTLYMPAFESVRLIACSPPSWMIQLALEEKRLSYVTKTLDFAHGEHRSPEMLALNPRGTIPVLTDGSRALYETFAILEYLEAAYPALPLLPGTRALDEHATVLNRFHTSNNLKSAGMALFAFLMRNPDPDPEGLSALRSALELAFWSDLLDATPFTCGSHLTLADLSVFTYLATAVHLGLRLEGSLAAFYDRIHSRTSVQRTWPSTWAEHGAQHTWLS